MHIEFACGHDQQIRDQQRKLAKRMLSRTSARELPLAVQRGIWFTSAVSHDGQCEDAVSLGLQLDASYKPIPAAGELGLEKVKPSKYPTKAATNILLLFGECGLPALTLIDALPRYLFHVSGCPTIILLDKKLAEETNHAFGWPYTANPISSLHEFVALVADSNPATSICGRAIAFAPEADSPDHFLLNSFNGVADAVPALVANEDAQQIAFRVWKAWASAQVGGGSVKEIPPTPPTEPAKEIKSNQ